MGAAGSVHRAVKTQVAKVHEQVLNREEEREKEQGERWMRSEARVSQLLSEKHALAEELRATEHSLRIQRENWQKERSKAIALMFSELPLSRLGIESVDSTDGPGDASLSKLFPMVTLAQCDVAGFAHLTTLMQPREVVKIIDHLHALIDGAFTGDEIFLMEHSVSGCIAASGLVESYPEPARSNATSQLSMTDSSYGSECDLEFSTSLKVKPKKITSPPPSRSATLAQSKEYPLPETPQHFAGVLATAALQLMSSSVRVDIPCSRSRQLQLRIALHSGPCLAGVVGLQTIPGTSRIPHYKLFGPTLRHTHNLCMTGLALQIRVSRQCHELLSGGDGFHFERCPDYTMWHSQKPIESYWLVSKEGLDLKLPSLDGALPLTEYDDTDV